MTDKSELQPEKKKSLYRDSLQSIAKARYMKKMELLGDKDPYELQTGWSSSNDDLADLTYPDIVNYLVNGRSAYTMDQMKAYKYLEAYNQFVCGWVSNVRSQYSQDKCLMIAKIMTKKGEWYETEEQAPDQFKNYWDSTMYPPLITEAQDAKLERCIRVLPHQQNTGAFFIAVVQKTQELPWLSGKTHRRVEPVINPRTRLDESEKKIAGSEDFTFGVRSAGGLYIYARCNLCNAKLQGKSDYNSHLHGRKHQTELED